MARLLTLLLISFLLTAGVAPSYSQLPPLPPLPPLPGPPGVALPSPAPPGVAPAWTPVPTSPLVLYAANIPGDVFRVKKRFYYYSGGDWYRSKHLQGPWRPVRKLPPPLYRVGRSYFKTPPPW